MRNRCIVIISNVKGPCNKLWRAHSWLYRIQILQANTRNSFYNIFKIYMICTLFHHSNLKTLETHLTIFSSKYLGKWLNLFNSCQNLTTFDTCDCQICQNWDGILTEEYMKTIRSLNYSIYDSFAALLSPRPVVSPHSRNNCRTRTASSARGSRSARAPGG